MPAVDPRPTGALGCGRGGGHVSRVPLPRCSRDQRGRGAQRRAKRGPPGPGGARRLAERRSTTRSEPARRASLRKPSHRLTEGTIQHSVRKLDHGPWGDFASTKASFHSSTLHARGLGMAPDHRTSRLASSASRRRRAARRRVALEDTAHLRRQLNQASQRQRTTSHRSSGTGPISGCRLTEAVPP